MKLKIKIYALLLPALLIISSVKAQQNAAPANSDTANVNTLSKGIGVSKEKAAQIKAAYNYKHDEIERVMRDKTIKPQQKHQLLNQLFAERRGQLAALKLSPEQLNALKQRQSEVLNKMEVYLQQHEAQLNSARQHRPFGSHTDSIKTVKH